MDYNTLLKERLLGNSFSTEELDLMSRLTGECYELGTKFGDRIIYLKDKIDIKGGCEINPMFHAYGERLNKLYQQGFMLDVVNEKDFKLPRRYQTIFSYKLLDNSLIKKEDVMKFCDRYIAYE